MIKAYLVRTTIEHVVLAENAREAENTAFEYIEDEIENAVISEAEPLTRGSQFARAAADRWYGCLPYGEYYNPEGKTVDRIIADGGVS